jgi:acyl-CoA synthetase (AMP-forming)/AMP-acid ligase II
MSSEPFDLREFVALDLARFKAIRWIAFCEIVPRHASGKPDYHRAAQLAESAISALPSTDAGG